MQIEQNEVDRSDEEQRHGKKNLKSNKDEKSDVLFIDARW